MPLTALTPRRPAAPRHRTALGRLAGALAWMGLWVGLIVSHARAATAPPPATAPVDLVALDLTGGEQARGLAGHLTVLEDPTRRLPIEQVREQPAGWSAARGGAVGLGFSHSVWWLRLRLHNPRTQPLQTVLDLQQPRQDDVEWFVLRPDGRLLQHALSGDRRPYAQRPMAYHGLALTIDVGAGETVDVYTRLDTHDGLYEAMRPTLDTPEAFARRLSFDGLVNGVYLGALLTLALYNLFLYVSLRERVFAAYVAYLAAFFVWSVVFLGFASQLVWPDRPDVANQMLGVGAALSLAGFTRFAVDFLRLPDRAGPRLVRAARTLAWIELAMAPLALLDRYAVYWALVLPLAAFSLLAELVVGAWQAWRGSREAKVYLLAFVPLNLGLGVTILQTLGLMPVLQGTAELWQFGAVLVASILSLGLVDTLQRTRASALAAERAAAASQRQWSARLENEVGERTRALQDANRELHTLSIVDELTGAFNRRHYNELCRMALASPGRGEPVLLCMFDIDHFKSYNDLYGRQAGDAALTQVAFAVSAELRRSADVLFRLGGEEFAVLAHARTPEAARAFVEHLREVMRTLGIVHAPSATGVLTASFGAMWFSRTDLVGLTPDALYAAVERQLYRAQREGRDRVAFAEASGGADAPRAD